MFLAASLTITKPKAKANEFKILFTEFVSKILEDAKYYLINKLDHEQSGGRIKWNHWIWNDIIVMLISFLGKDIKLRDLTLKAQEEGHSIKLFLCQNDKYIKL